MMRGIGKLLCVALVFNDLAAAEAQYHIRCYDEFRKVPVKSDQFPLIEEAMQLLVNEMYTNRLLRTWISIELHDRYMIYGGNLTREQMLTKVLTYFGDDVTVLSIEGCASIVGFREHVSKIVKISRVDNEDEESKDTLVETYHNRSTSYSLQQQELRPW